MKNFGQKFVFEQKFAIKTVFPWNTTMIGIQIWFSDYFRLFYISLQQKVRSFAFVFGKHDESLDVPTVVPKLL